ncbi:hypothetical protein [Streptomyces sp. NPDC097619]|uniref:hypothetical protein n=1 Tax=Streptomyces sp. NPDC097619 TaxID=3157228 RepID=UPI00331D2C91
MRVTGTWDDGTAYDVQITDGAVTGSRRIRALVGQFTGKPVLLGPLGPQRPVSVTDGATVLGLLRRHTTVVEVRP